MISASPWLKRYQKRKLGRKRTLVNRRYGKERRFGADSDIAALNVFAFDVNGGALYAIWNNSRQTGVLKYQTSCPELLTVDTNGGATQVNCHDGKGELKIGQQPFFLYAEDRSKVIFSP